MAKTTLFPYSVVAFDGPLALWANDLDLWNDPTSEKVSACAETLGILQVDEFTLPGSIVIDLPEGRDIQIPASQRAAIQCHWAMLKARKRRAKKIARWLRAFPQLDDLANELLEIEHQETPDAARRREVLTEVAAALRAECVHRGLCGLTTKPTAPADGFTKAALREMTGLGNKALSNAAERAGVKTGKRGHKEYLYPPADAIAILQAIIAKTSEVELIKRCTKALSKIAE